MLVTKKQLGVRMVSFKPKLNTEGQKLVTVSLTMPEGKGSVRGALAEAITCMKANDSLDGIACENKMESVRLVFSSPARPDTAQITFDITTLFGFTLDREKTTEAGTLNAEQSGRIMVNFKFTVPLVEGGAWVVEEYSNDLLMLIEKEQGELPLEPSAPGQETQEDRNERIIEAEAEDGVKVESEKPKRSRKKKS